MHTLSISSISVMHREHTVRFLDRVAVASIGEVHVTTRDIRISCYDIISRHGGHIGHFIIGAYYSSYRR